MKPTNSPGFNYRNNLGRPVEVRLRKVDQLNHYALQFRIKGKYPIHPWHTVRQYTPLNSPVYPPGSPESHTYGRWHEFTVHLISMEHAQEELASLKERLHTVSDIYRFCIEKGLAEEVQDWENYMYYHRKRDIPRVLR